MTLYIGCPNSVEGMLQSIVNRRIKRWQANNSLETDDRKVWLSGKDKVVSKGVKKGKQLKSLNEMARLRKSKGYYGEPGKILTGHFRWNNQGYILSRRCTDILNEFLTN